MPAVELAAAFPVLKETAYLNAGTCGPVPQPSLDAINVVLQSGTNQGRGLPYYESLLATSGQVREAWGRLLSTPSTELALTAGASDGMARTLAMMPWAPGDEIVTTDEEHPGLLGPLGALARRRGVVVKTAPWDEVAAAVTSATRLIAVSHVSWLRGAVIDLAPLTATGLPILLDGAQSAGAIAVDLSVLRHQGVVAYAAAGQKWTCGPVGTGALWIDELWAPDRGLGVWPTYEALQNPSAGLDATTWPDARRFDAPSISLEAHAGILASLQLLEGHGWSSLHAAAVQRADATAEALTAAGIDVLDRGPSTLVTWRAADPEPVLTQAAQAGVVIRGFPGLPYVRASIGAWTTDEHLDRLLAVATAG